jgi:hypothetical protein
MKAALIDMTRERANQILDLWKRGIEQFPDQVIRLALYVTGDLVSLR